MSRSPSEEQNLGSPTEPVCGATEMAGPKGKAKNSVESVARRNHSHTADAHGREATEEEEYETANKGA